MACADSGADKILIRESDAHDAHLSIAKAVNPLVVLFPDSETATAIGTTHVALPSTSVSLPAHVFADDTLRTSLFSLTDIAHAGYDTQLNHTGLTISQHGYHVHFSPKTDTGWQLPILAPTAVANAVMSLPSDKAFVQFMHAAFGSPAISTFLRAARRGYLNTLPRLTAKMICTHKPISVATAMGHLDQQRQGLDSTTPKPSQSSPSHIAPDSRSSDSDDDEIPDDGPPTLFCKLYSTADIDATARFPVQSAQKHEYILVSYFKGYIHVQPMSSRHHTAYIKAYSQTFDFWATYGPLPAVVRLDNETSHQLEAFIAPHASFKYFAPGNHRASRAERGIRTWKNHFIATLATASSKFPLNQWDQLLPLAELTLNCLLPWHPDPTISSFHGLTGAMFDFRAHPIAPAGTAILIHDKPDARPSWATHGTPGFYFGPALQHYRCHNVYSTVNKSHRISDTIAWFPEAVVMPVTAPNDILLAAISDLTIALHRSRNSTTPTIAPPPSLAPALIELATMYSQYSPENEQIVVHPSSPQHGAEPRVPPTVSPEDSSIPPLLHGPAEKPVSQPPTADAIPIAQPHRNVLSPLHSTAPIAPPTHTYLTRQSTRTINHIAKANGAVSLNSNPDGSPLTFRSALNGPNQQQWKAAEDAEISRLLDTKTMHPIHRSDQPSDRRKDTTYYNPKPKEKFDLDNITKLYRIRGTIGGDKIHYDGATKANTAAMPVVKMLLQSAISEDANWMTADLKDYYLMTPLPRPEYLLIQKKHLSQHIITKYDLHQYLDNDHILFEVIRSMYGLPHAGRIAQEALIPHLAKHGYLQTSTPCLFRHTSNGTAFTLVVDDFGIKYRTKQDAEHLIACLKEKYDLTIRWNGEYYLGMRIDFDRAARTVSLSIPDYVTKALRRFAPHLTKGARSPALYFPPAYGSPDSQNPTVIDTSPLLSTADHKNLQAIIGVLLYYCLAVDLTGLPAVTALASAQSTATRTTQAAANRLLAYFFSFPNNKLVLRACGMRLHIQSDASYLSRPNARSVAGGIAYLSNDDPTEVNGAIHAFSSLIPNVMASVAEAEYAALFMNGQNGAGFRQVLHDLGYPQPATIILVDNQCARGIATNTVQPKRTKSIDMKYHWIRDRVGQKQFNVIWRPGSLNLADFFTKALPVHVHASLMPLLVSSPPSSPAFHTKAASRALSWRRSFQYQ